MKILSLALACTAILALTVACDNGSNLQECTVDEDCADNADAPVCGESGFCEGGGVDECAADLDCQIIDGSNGADCTSSTDCPADEACAEGFDGAGFCLVTGDADTCALVPGFQTESLAEVGGAGNVDVCVSTDGTCADGACTFE